MSQAGYAPGQERGPIEQAKQYFGVLTWFLQVFSFPHAIYTRRAGSMGKNYLSVPAAIAFFLYVPFMVLLCPPKSGDEMRLITWYWLGMFVMLIVHAFARASRQRRGETIHSRFIGDPVLTLIPGISESTAWSLTTAAGVIGGAILTGWSGTVGTAVALSAAADGLYRGMLTVRDQKQTDAAVDAYLEAECFNQQVQERLHERHWN